QWELQGGEQYRNDDVIDVSAAGTFRMSQPELTGLRLSGRHRTVEASVMDAEAIIIGRQAQLNRLRGGVVRYTDPHASRWVLLGGVPTPVPNTPTPDIALGGAAVENVHFDVAELSASAFGFWRGARAPQYGTFPDTDTLPGRGAIGNLAW